MESLNQQRFADEPISETQPPTMPTEPIAQPPQGATANPAENTETGNNHPALSKPGTNPEDETPWGRYQPIMDALKDTMKERYGITTDDPKHIAEIMRQEAIKEKEERQRQEEENRMKKHFSSLMQQADELKKTFTSFDLQEELKNPDFLRLTSPGSPLSLKHAFYAVHGDEILQDSTRYAAQKTEERIKESIKENAHRAAENGIVQANAVPLTLHVESMDKETRAKYRERIHNGELINFRDLI